MVGNVVIPFCDLTEQHRFLKDELIQAFREVVENASFIGGPDVAGFEKEFAQFIGTRFAIGISNGTEALRLALLAMGIGPGSKVITVPNSFIATTEAISQTGAEICFVDIDRDTSLMDPDRLETYLKSVFTDNQKGKRPSAIIPVHLYGQSADMDAITSLASQYGLFVLEDAAQAHGATYKGRTVGTMGDAGAFSFYPTKNLGACGDAGAVVTNNPALAEIIFMLREHGQKIKYYHDIEGCNARLDALQARILRIKLPLLRMWNEKRQKIAQVYNTELANIPWIRSVKVANHNVSCYHLYVVHAKKRDALQNYLKKNGIMTAQHYPVCLHLQKCYSHLNFQAGSFPNAERAATELLSLPMFPELGLDSVRYVIETIKSFENPS